MGWQPGGPDLPRQHGLADAGGDQQPPVGPPTGAGGGAGSTGASRSGAGGTRAAPAEEPPEEFIDPISQELMLVDPVLLVETGQSYERASIEAWFRRCAADKLPCTDPLTHTQLRSTALAPNYALKSLVAGWAERQRIADLPSFSKAVARQRTLTQRGPGAAATTVAEAAAAALAGMHLGGVGGTGSGRDPASHQQQQQQQPPPALYPSLQHPPAVASMQAQAETALAALRAAATQRGGSSRGGGSSYHAWTIKQLASDAQGRQLLWQGNAVPLAIFLLGLEEQGQQLEQRDSAGPPLDSAKPALCGMLQRLGAADPEVAASIVQCGGTHALVPQLTAARSEQRAAAAQALYFLGRQGSEIRAGILQALAQHAAACRLPAGPLLAFWRFWEQPQQAAGTSPSSGGGEGSSDDTSGSSSSSLSAGREAEWESLALLLHMLADGSNSGSSNPIGSSAASSPTALALLDVSATAVPVVLAHAAAASESPAVRFAAFQAAKLLAQLPQNLPLLLEASAREGQQQASSSRGSTIGSMAAGNAAWLLWDLVYSPAKHTSQPAAVEMVQQHAGQLLPALEAALDPQHPAGVWLAAGLLACLLYEPPHIGNGRAAAAADGMRRLLVSHTARPVLRQLVGLLQAEAAAADPQAATLAALAVANLAAYRGAAVATADRPATAAVGSPRLDRSSSADVGQGAAHSQLDSGGGFARLTAKLTAAVRKQASSLQTPAQEPASPPAQQQQQQQPTDPRGELLCHEAMPLLLRLVINCSAAAAAAGGTSQGQQAAAAAAVKRGMLAAALQALNNLCADPAAAGAIRAWARSTAEAQQQLSAALAAAMGDRQLDATCRDHARLLLRTQSGAPGQWHANVCSCPAPPPQVAAYPTP